MGELVEFKSRRARKPEEVDPHLSGLAACACGHEWVAVAPVGTFKLQCPSCLKMDGRFKNECMRVGEYHWQCACGNLYFAITKGCVYCPDCGEVQQGF